MKNVFLTSILSFVAIVCYSQNYTTYPVYQPRPYTDIYGNHYSNFNNLNKDTDNDGLLNWNDNNDKSKDVYKSYDIPIYNNTAPTYNYSAPAYNSTPSNYDTYSTKTIYTGPQGGQYYINSNGNKTYIKRDNPW